MRRLWLSLALVAAVAVLAGSVALAIGNAHGGGYVRTAYGRGAGTVGGANVRGGAGAMMGGAGAGMMSGAGGPGSAAGMMGGVWLTGDGTRVTSIAAARARATTAATPSGLHTGEVIWFDNGFYVELKDATGAAATEVIVDPQTGAVSTEPGPAMMWNTRYGMHRTAAAATVSAERARQIATAWLATNQPGWRVTEPDAYPGYYTLETTTAQGAINGMLSVNAATGAVWYHTWHGAFIAREDS